MGYIKDNKLYNMDDEVVGDYSSEGKEKLLDKSTTYLYKYEKEADNYILKSVELCVKESK